MTEKCAADPTVLNAALRIQQSRLPMSAFGKHSVVTARLRLLDIQRAVHDEATGCTAHHDENAFAVQGLSLLESFCIAMLLRRSAPGADASSTAARHSAITAVLSLTQGLGYRSPEVLEDLQGRGLPPAALARLGAAQAYMVRWDAKWGLEYCTKARSWLHKVPLAPGGYNPPRMQYGMLVPALTPLGEVLGGQIKTLDADRKADPDAPSYVTLGGGFSAEPLACTEAGDLPLHAFVPDSFAEQTAEDGRGAFAPLTVGLCEGGFKPAVAAAALNMPFIGAQGGMYGSKRNGYTHQLLLEYMLALERVVAHRQCEVALRQAREGPPLRSRVLRVLLFPDAGSTRNCQLSHAMLRAACVLRAAGWPVQVAWWGQAVKPEDAARITQLPNATLQRKLLQEVDNAGMRGVWRGVFSSDPDELCTLQLPMESRNTPVPLPRLDPFHEPMECAQYANPPTHSTVVLSAVQAIQCYPLHAWSTHCLQSSVRNEMNAKPRPRAESSTVHILPAAAVPHPDEFCMWDIASDTVGVRLDPTVCDLVSRIERAWHLTPLKMDVTLNTPRSSASAPPLKLTVGQTMAGRACMSGHLGRQQRTPMDTVPPPSVAEAPPTAPAAHTHHTSAFSSGSPPQRQPAPAASAAGSAAAFGGGTSTPRGGASTPGASDKSASHRSAFTASAPDTPAAATQADSAAEQSPPPASPAPAGSPPRTAPPAAPVQARHAHSPASPAGSANLNNSGWDLGAAASPLNCAPAPAPVAAPAPAPAPAPVAAPPAPVAATSPTTHGHGGNGDSHSSAFSAAFLRAGGSPVLGDDWHLQVPGRTDAVSPVSAQD